MRNALLFALTVPLLLAACAVTPQAPPEARVQTQVVHRVDCLQTGTRIHLKADECASGAGHVFSKDELDRTGSIDTAEALRRLDPSINP